VHEYTVELPAAAHPLKDLRLDPGNAPALSAWPTGAEGGEGKVLKPGSATRRPKPPRRPDCACAVRGRNCMNNAVFCHGPNAMAERVPFGTCFHRHCPLPLAFLASSGEPRRASRLYPWISESSASSSG